MPTKKRDPATGPSIRALNLYRLRRIARDLEIGEPLSDTDRQFIVTTFKAIGGGEDPKGVLGIKGSRGKRDNENTKARMAMIYIASCIAPEAEGGKGMSLDDAIAEAAEEYSQGASFGLSEETLRYYWTHNIYGQGRAMPRPIETLPDYPPGWGKEPK